MILISSTHVSQPGPSPITVKCTKTISGTLGLINLGNTCFMNAALQCLAHTTLLADFIFSRKFEDVLSTDQMFGHSFVEVIHNIYHSQSLSYSPQRFLEEFTTFTGQFGDGRQRKCLLLEYGLNLFIDLTDSTYIFLIVV